MRQITTTVTKAGQITLPAEVRRALGVKARDRVVFTIENGSVSIAPMKYTIETAAGALPATKTEDIDRMIREAQEEMADKVVRSMRAD